MKLKSFYIGKQIVYPVKIEPTEKLFTQRTLGQHITEILKYRYLFQHYSQYINYGTNLCGQLQRT